jgi:hypothetical protein
LTDRMLLDKASLFERNHRAQLAYRPRSTWGGRLIFIQPEVTNAQSNWSSWVRGGVTVEVRPGDHHSVLSNSAPSIRRWLDDKT